MIRRFVTTTALSVLVVALSAAPAFAWWSNGGDGGYRTHDWLLENAVVNAGSPDWVDLEAALDAADDPDTYKVSSYLQTYHPIGKARGGPQQVSNEYYKLIQAYQAGDYTEASRQLGLMSHYLSDICQPYHTDPRGNSTENARHAKYEEDVAMKYTSSFDMAPDWWTSNRTRKSLAGTDVRAVAVSAAKYARTKYVNLDSSYKSYGLVKDKYAYTASGLVLNRAINDLADIIAAVPDGQGVALPPAKISQYMTRTIYRYPRNGQFVCSGAKVYNAEGKPIEGVAVKFTWPGGSTTGYSDSTGYAYSWQTLGKYTLMNRKTVNSLASVSGLVATQTAWFMPTPVLASGQTGVKTSVSNNRPKRYTTVKVKTKFVSTSGKAVKGLPVTFYWYFKSKTVKIKAVTDSYGYARCSYKIGGATKGYRVYVKGQAYSGGHKRYSQASFIPQ